VLREIKRREQEMFLLSHLSAIDPLRCRRRRHFTPRLFNRLEINEIIIIIIMRQEERFKVQNDKIRSLALLYYSTLDTNDIKDEGL
jgi:hypothetical protein